MLKPSNKLRAYLLRAEEWGLDPVAILEGSGLGWNEIKSAGSFDLDVFDRLFDHVARHTPRDFAIRCGQTTKVRDFGIIGLAMASMTTLREAFQQWNRYSLLSGQPLFTSIIETGDQWRMVFMPRRHMSAEAQRFCIEASIAAMEPVIEELTGAPAHTLGLELPLTRPASLDHYSRLRCRNIGFNHELASYCGRRADLDRTIPAADQEITEALREECEQFLATLTLPRSISEHLADMIRSSSGKIPSLQDIARSLSVSCRSLQRDLSHEGLTYQELVRRFRHERAMVLLQAQRPNIKEIAFVLGFHDVGSFRRAFRQWTGQSIRAWQKQAARQSQIPRKTKIARGIADGSPVTGDRCRSRGGRDLIPSLYQEDRSDCAEGRGLYQGNAPVSIVRRNVPLALGTE